MENKESYKQFREKEKRKNPGISNSIIRARWQEHLVTPMAQGKSRQIRTNVSTKSINFRPKTKPRRKEKFESEEWWSLYGGSKVEKEEFIQHLKESLDPMSTGPIRLSAGGIEAKSLTYTRQGIQTINCPATAAEVLVVSAGAQVGSLTTSILARYSNAVVNVSTNLTPSSVGSALMVSTQMPENARIIDNRPTQFVMEIIYEGPIQSAKGEILFGRIPSAAVSTAVTYNELANYPTMRRTNLGEMINGKKLTIPYVRNSQAALTFKSISGGADDISVPMFLATNLDTSGAFAVRIYEGGEFFAAIDDPLWLRAGRPIGHRKSQIAANNLIEDAVLGLFGTPTGAGNLNWVTDIVKEARQTKQGRLIESGFELGKNLANLLF